MTDQEFAQLKIDLEDAMDEVDRLQTIYQNETGCYFVRPLRLAPRKERFDDRDKPL